MNEPIKIYSPNKKVFLELFANGLVKILDKSYLNQENGLEISFDTISLFTKNNEISIDELPYNTRKKLNETLFNVFKDEQRKHDSMEMLNYFKSFGLTKERETLLKKHRLSTLKNVLTLGIEGLEEMYLKSIYDTLSFIGITPATKQVDREKVAVFVDEYRTKGIQDFNYFRDALKEFGVEDEKEVLQEYNDSIDSSFSTEEFAFASRAKSKILESQLAIIEAAIEDGLLPPSDLTKFSNKINPIYDEKIAPQIVDTISQIDFHKEEKSWLFNNNSINGETDQQLREMFSKEFKNFNADKSININLVNLFTIRNNGLSYEKMLEWAKFSSESKLVGTSEAYSFAILAAKHNQKLVQCGILSSEDGKNFKFTSQKAREILYNNYDRGYNVLAQEIMSLYNITPPVVTSNSIANKEAKDGYEYVREPKLSTHALNGKIKDKWSELQSLNRNSEDMEIERQFIILSALKFDGVSLDSLESWKTWSMEKRNINEEVADKFIENSIANAEELTQIGILKKAGDDTWKFTDRYAKETLFNHYASSYLDIELANFGELIKIESKQNSDTTPIEETPNVTKEEQKVQVREKAVKTTTKEPQPKDKSQKKARPLVEPLTISSSLTQPQQNLLKSLLQFNFSYTKSKDTSFVEEARSQEREMMEEIREHFMFDKTFANELKKVLEHKTTQVDIAKALGRNGINPYMGNFDFSTINSLDKLSLEEIALTGSSIEKFIKVSPFYTKDTQITLLTLLRDIIENVNNKIITTKEEVINELKKFVDDFSLHVMIESQKASKSIAQAVSEINKDTTQELQQ